MAQNTQTFILVGDFKDNITPKLRKLNRELTKFSKDLNKSLKDATKGIDRDFEKLSKNAEKSIKGIGKGFDKAIGDAGRSVGKLETSLNDAGRAAGKVRDTVSQIGEGLKGFDSLAESMEGVARAAGRAQDEVLGIGEAASRANRQADDLMTTLLKAEGLSRFGDAMSQGFGRSVNALTTVASKGGGVVGKAFSDAMQDELADVKAASGIQGSFGLAGFKGEFSDAQKMYKKYDQVVSEMIRQSSAPTAKVVELQRYTLDTMGPLMLAAEGVAKGTAMKDIDPKKIESSAANYGRFLEKVALFSQGTGSAGFRVAAGIEGLVTRGKIDTTIDFFTDNIMLMKNLEAAGFAGRGMRSAKMMTATDAERMKAMMDAFNKSMSSESTAAMAQSLTGSLQGLQDTLFNPSVGILGMAVTFTKEEQKTANASIKRIMDARIKGYQNELKNVKISEKRREELNNSIAQATATRDKLLKEDTISTPFKAFSYAFTGLIQGLTNVINAIGPVWTQLSIAMIEVTDRVFAPLTETLGNVASDMRGGKYTQMEGFGRIIGEIFKTIGEIFADLAKMLTDPNSAMGKAQSEFMKGFMDAFKEPGSLEKAKKGLSDGVNALVGKIFSVLMSVITSDAMRPIVIPFLALMFGPPLISAVIAGATPLIINSILRMFTGLGSKVIPKVAPKAGAAAAATRGGIGAVVAGQAAKSAGVGAKLPGVAKAAAVAKGVKMKGVGTIAAGMVTLATHAPELQKAGKAVMGLGKRLPLLSIAFAGLDFAAKKAEGKSNLEAGGAAVGGLVGGTAGAAIGQALIPIPGVGAVAGGVVGSAIGSWIGENVVPAIKAIPGMLSGAWNGLKTWLYNLPGQIVSGIGYALGYLEGAWARFSSWFMGLGPKFTAWLSSALAAINGAWTKFMGQLRAVFADPGKYFVGAAQSLGNAIGQAVRNAFNWAKQQLTNFGGWINQQKQNFARSRAEGRTSAIGAAFGSPGVPFGTLGEAINYEMANKPKGSELVIANSSETIIPKGGAIPAANGLNIPAFSAADGLGGMKGVIDAIWRSGAQVAATTMRGFDELRNTIAIGDAKNASATARAGALTKSAIDRSIAVSMAGDAKIMSAIKAAAAAGGFGADMGGSLGAASGNLQAAAAMAKGMGLTMTSYKRSGPPNASYHNVGRAMDFSNSTGPTPQMMQFAQSMAAKYGSSMAELIYTPLGYGIKNGKKVAPYAQAGHYNHVHVAFAHGLSNPRLFTSAKAAAAYEGMMAPAGAQVLQAKTTTLNSSELGAKNVTVHQNISIDGAQDPRKLAEMVFNYAAQAAEHINNSSFA